MSRCSNSPNCHHDPACADLACPGRPETARPVKLQVNANGSWRNVLDFDASDAQVLDLAATLFERDPAADRLALRVIAQGDTAPLMNWTRERGWREWRAVG